MALMDPDKAIPIRPGFNEDPWQEKMKSTAEMAAVWFVPLELRLLLQLSLADSHGVTP